MTRIAAAGTTLVFILAVAVGAAGCGDDDSVSQEELQQQVDQAREQAKQNAELQDLRDQIEALRKQQGEGGDETTTTGGGDTTTGGGTSGGLPSDAESCGAGVYAREGTTSCSFALNVAADYYASGSNTFESYSPATGETYTMSCSGVDPVVCTGGNNAAVYLP